MKRQRGAFLAIMAVLIIALLGFAALAIDVGRVLVLRSEMQNAADAAALAAAFELDSNTDAIERAKIAARNALDHNSHFARVREMLTPETLPESAFVFFCVIGASHDVDASDPEVDLSRFCGNTTPYAASGVDARKYEAAGDSDAHYVRVRLAASDSATDNFTLDLIFFPVIRLLGGGDVISALSLEAVALAGRNFFFCNFPPMAICDPWEGNGGFRENMTIGGSIQIKPPGGSAWQKGNYGLLQSEKFSGDEKYDYYADEGDLGCSPPILSTSPGVKLQKVKSAVNTRFGIYNADDLDHYNDRYAPVVSPGKDAQGEFSAATNIREYPVDETTQDIGEDGSESRFGNGDWRCFDYWDEQEYALSQPDGCTNPPLNPTQTRWDIYNYELENNLELKDTESDSGEQNLDRRRLFIAVLSCEALGIKGSTKDFALFNPDGFAEIFLIKPATDNQSKDKDGNTVPDEEKKSIFGEYIGWGDESDATFHVDVQLYE